MEAYLQGHRSDKAHNMYAASVKGYEKAGMRNECQWDYSFPHAILEKCRCQSGSYISSADSNNRDGQRYSSATRAE